MHALLSPPPLPLTRLLPRFPPPVSSLCRAMEIHAEYFLRCPDVAKWLNTPQPVLGIPKEFLDGAHAVTTRSEPHPRSPDPHGPRGPRRAVLSPPSSLTPSPKRPRSPRSLRSPRSSASTPPAKLPAKPPSSPPACASDSMLLEAGFPAIRDLPSVVHEKSLLYVPVELREHFIFGVALGCPIPPPAGVDPRMWKPLVNRFVLDVGRRCLMMFSYFAEGSIAVMVDCFDESGDHYAEATIFESTPVVGAFPRGIRGRLQISETRDCPDCLDDGVKCECAKPDRVFAFFQRKSPYARVPEQGPAHAGATYQDEQVTIKTYPYWAQALDEYKWCRAGTYSVQVRYTSTSCRSIDAVREADIVTATYRSVVKAEPRPKVEQMLRVGFFEKGVSALKPPATDVRWETSSTVCVNAKNEISSVNDPVSAVCFTDLHKLPGLQLDYLLVAPSNIISTAEARRELARAEEERLAAQARVGVPVLPTWASGRDGVFKHIVTESGPELNQLVGDIAALERRDSAFHTSRDHYHATLMQNMQQGSVATVTRPRKAIEKLRTSGGRRDTPAVPSPLRRHSADVPSSRAAPDAARAAVDDRRRKSVDGSFASPSRAPRYGAVAPVAQVDSNRRRKRRA